MLGIRLPFRATYSEVLLLVIGFMLTGMLFTIPPLSIAGLPMYFYLAPALLVGYCVPFWLYVTGLLCIITFANYMVGGLSPTTAPESLVSAIFLIAVFVWRSLTSQSDTLIVAATLLIVLAFPFMALLNFSWAGLNAHLSLLLASRYAVNGLFSVVLAEVLILTVKLSEWPSLQAIRKMLGFRPSLLQIIEFVVTISVVVSLLAELLLFWQNLDDSLKTRARADADTRLDALYLVAEATLTERFAQATVSAEIMREKGLDAKIIPEMGRLLTHRGAASSTEATESLDYAVVFGDGLTLATPGLSADVVDRAIALARVQSAERNTLLALNIVLADGEKHAFSVFLGDDGQPSALIRYHSLSDALLFEFRHARQVYRALFGNTLSLAKEGAVDVRSGFGLPPNTRILSDPNDDRISWVPSASENIQRGRIFIARVTVDTQLTLMPSPAYIDRYSRKLHGAGEFRVTLSYWPYFISFAEPVILSTLLSSVILMILLWAARMSFMRSMSPLSKLTHIFENWRQVSGAGLASAVALPVDLGGDSALSDIHGLQVGFRSLVQDVMHAERRLSTIAANYDELLRSVPLGVLAVDGSSQIQFLNDALGEITGQRQDAMVRLTTQAAQMLAAGTPVDEWQLVLEERAPRSLLLVVNRRLDDRGQESGFWVIATDLTAQKQTSAQLIQAAKLATLGEMSTGMAHELNQPLNVIALAASNLRFTIKKGNGTSENTLSKLDRIESAVHRAASIIDHMRAYGRLAGEGMSEVNVGEICAGACNLVGEQLKLANISLINQVLDETLWVEGNAIQLEQVLINLINNAKDAIKSGAEKGMVTLDAELIDDRILLRVTDTGGGIPSHVLPHIFEPFFTTKPVGKGTGLGGSISYGIVREMQGDMWVENVPGGAQITISLPLMKQG